MLRIGLTGGIGSGKSTVAKIFASLGIPIYYADEENKRLMNEDESVKSAILQHFGADSYKEGKLDRRYIASQVFGNKEKLELLNSITHPAVIRHAEQWMKQKEELYRDTVPYVIKEAALIFESGSDKDLDLVIGVWSPQPLRIRRVMLRDNVSDEEVLRRMEGQMDEDEKMQRCDFIINNDEESLVTPQVIALHERFVERSRRRK
jgi:dephospho-CoA kinase